jgi:hypothetical protein
MNEQPAEHLTFVAQPPAAIPDPQRAFGAAAIRTALVVGTVLMERLQDEYDIAVDSRRFELL